MQTPEGWAGEATEEIMADWLRRLADKKEPKPTTATYNAAYEAALGVLSRQNSRG